MLIALALMSLIAAISFTHPVRIYELHSAKTFAAQLQSALKLAQALSLTRQESLTLCAIQQNHCQENWHGVLTVFSKGHLSIQHFGTTPNNLKITYSGFNNKKYLLIQSHGLEINNGSFIISNSKQEIIATLSISKEGVITFHETS